MPQGGNGRGADRRGIGRFILSSRSPKGGSFSSGSKGGSFLGGSKGGSSSSSGKSGKKGIKSSKKDSASKEKHSPFYSGEDVTSAAIPLKQNLLGILLKPQTKSKRNNNGENVLRPLPFDAQGYAHGYRIGYSDGAGSVSPKASKSSLSPSTACKENGWRSSSSSSSSFGQSNHICERTSDKFEIVAAFCVLGLLALLIFWLLGWLCWRDVKWWENRRRDKV